MTEPDDLYAEGAECELTEVAWAPPAVVLRIVYDEQGKISTVMTEYRDAPSANELSRLVAQFLTLQAQTMPTRTPGANMPRDPVLDRQFRAVLGQCMAVMNIVNMSGPHSNHECALADRHTGRHRCDCGQYFGV